MKPMRLLTSLVALVLVAAPAGAQAPDRSAPPAPGPAPALKLPAIEKRALSNGLPVWIVEKHAVPVAQVTLVVRAGSGADPESRFGLARLTADMLDEGAGGKSALELADAVDFLGADLSTGSSYDASLVSLHVPVARLAPALALMGDVALRPAFAAADLNRLREERLTALGQAHDSPPAIAAAAFPLLVYGAGRRYGIGAGGTEETLRAFTPGDLKWFHDQYYRPDDAALIVVGDVTPETVVPELERVFGAWKAAGPRPAPPALAAPPKMDERRVYLVDKPGAAQSVIRIGGVGVERSTSDFFPLEVMNTILGGSFTSRLNQNLREQHGYTYGAGSRFDMRLGAGPFYATAMVQTDKTAESLTEFFKELQGIRQPVPAAELERAKNYVALSYPGQFETTRQMAAQLAQLVVYRLPDDYFSTYVANIQAVTAADVQRVAEKYITPGRFAVVIVGDRKTIEPKVEALKLGPIRQLTVDDVMK
jgi:predicted Zn-dependent peptidase